VTLKYQNGDWLEQKYVDERMSTAEIGELCDCSKETIRRWLSSHGIETRTKSEAAKIRAKKYPHTTNAGAKALSRNRSVHPNVFTHKQNGYERVQCGVNKEQVSLHRLLAVAEYGFDAVTDKVVHHKSNIPWDNRPDNIELMDAGEHSSHHRSGKAKEHWRRGDMG
jgi:hypothetical protein